MKRFPVILLSLAALCLPSCITLDLGYTGTDEDGKSFHIGVKGDIPWPVKKADEPALPQWDGKNPVPVAP